jgi:hypothetical protein
VVTQQDMAWQSCENMFGVPVAFQTEGEMKIKFVVEAKRYHDKLNGNTYHSCRVTRCRDGKTIVAPFGYGYGDAYR